MVNLPLYFMRFPQEIKGTYYSLNNKQGWLMTMDCPEWPVAYRFNKTKDKIEVWVGWVPGKRDNGDVNFNNILNWKNHA